MTLSNDFNQGAQMKTTLVLLTATLALMMGPFSNAAAPGAEPADVIGQGPFGLVVSDDGASLMRTANGLNISLVMPTPASGSYIYPDPNAFQPTVVVGHPEAFTGWAFVFNYPDECTDPCNSDDLGSDKPAKGGAYNFAGHVVGGSTLRLSGRLNVGEEPFVGAPLENPPGAEVHLAVAPHGEVQPDLLPVQITFPIGTADHWWLAFFVP